MIGGIGADILRIARMEKALSRGEAFARRVFTDEERDYIFRSGKPNAASAAAVFAAKEAVAKALGSGFRGFSPADVEIYHDERGAPHARLHNAARKMARDGRWHLSLSHEREYAIAYAIWELGEERP